MRRILEAQPNKKCPPTDGLLVVAAALALPQSPPAPHGHAGTLAEVYRARKKSEPRIAIASIGRIMQIICSNYFDKKKFEMRNLNLDQLRALIEVIELGSFSAAARRLNLTQPAVSQQI